jgi:DNA modification methylase
MIAHSDAWLTVHQGDCREVLPELPDASVDCVVTSPPYWGLRDYGVDGQLGLEPTPEQYVADLVAVFREVRRVLKSEGTLFLNLGDSYFTRSVMRDRGNRDVIEGFAGKDLGSWADNASRGRTRLSSGHPTLKDKDLIGIPWRVALALQADGWWIRSEIIWAKTSVLPESVQDRPTKAHETIFLLSRSRRYYYDAESVRQPDKGGDHSRIKLTPPEPTGGLRKPHMGIRYREGRNGRGANLRTVWTMAAKPYPGTHFAVFPPELPERCIKAGCPENGVVLDPFAGSGTVGLVANRLSRRAILIDLNPSYIDQQMLRNAQTPLGLTEPVA